MASYKHTQENEKKVGYFFILLKLYRYRCATLFSNKSIYLDIKFHPTTQISHSSFSSNLNERTKYATTKH